ncbi:MAG: hypothetical protein JWP52_1788, partial [Rhizobacter sp.]|nr:hypothetical protein [Rhizobacter sp.]
VFKAPAGVLGLIMSRKRPKTTRSMTPGSAH